MHAAVELFLAALAFFHSSEALLAVIFNPRDVGWRSWLFSKPYVAAMSLAIVEYYAELQFFPALKVCRLSAPPGRLGATQQLGLAMVLAGELLRKAAILTAGTSFTHLVQLTRRPQHVLVTRGVYRFCRHPGYCGWFIWAVGTQVLLLNPVCAVLFTGAAWRFFKQRIAFEEARLLEFFGAEYAAYAARTRTWIPGIA